MQSSADIIRERRRLKILEKSEERMKRLLVGSTDSTDPPADCLESTANGSPNVECTAATHNSSVVDDEDSVDGHHLHPHPSPKRVANNTPRPPSQEPSFEPDVDRKPEAVPRDANSSQYYWTVRHLSFSSLGFLIRLLLCFDFSRRLVQTIFNPFVAVEVAWFGCEWTFGQDWYRDIAPSGLSRMWLTVFVLIGVHQDLLTTYQRIIAVVSAVLNDFTFYFFAFILTHLFV